MLVRISSKVGESEDGNSLRDPERGEAECRQTQVDDQHDFMTLHNYFDIRTETLASAEVGGQQVQHSQSDPHCRQGGVGLRSKSSDTAICLFL